MWREFGNGASPERGHRVNPASADIGMTANVPADVNLARMG
jgi:hypothetical protein